jgi:DNA replication ATP-dependent helicase Dna2
VVAFGETASADHRRRLVNSVVQLCPPPRFNHVSEQSIFAHCIQGIPGCDAASLKRDFDLLNVDQKAAVRKVLSARDFALIEGFPGTGKSATIALATRMLVAQGKRVLLTSYTHSAVDNILTKLMDGGVKPSSASTWSPVLRIARQASCSPTVRPILAETVACEAERNAPGDHSASSIGRPRVDYLEKVVTTAKVVGITALTAPRSPLLAGQHFDVVIVDEAGQMSQPAVLGAIMAADSFVLVGDHMQVSNAKCQMGRLFCFRPPHSSPFSILCSFLPW